MFHAERELEHWHESLADPTVADATKLVGESMRKALANAQHEKLNNA